MDGDLAFQPTLSRCENGIEKQTIFALCDACIDRYPQIKIIIHADGDFSCPAFYRLANKHSLFYPIGIASNEVVMMNYTLGSLSVKMERRVRNSLNLSL